jgi:hypothetical protein
LKENTQPSVFIADICHLLREQGFHAYTRTFDIPDDLVKRLGIERGILDDDTEKTLDDFDTSDMKDYLESKGFDVIDQYDFESYTGESIREALSNLYYKRLRGESIEEELNTLILIAANRIV